MKGQTLSAVRFCIRLVLVLVLCALALAIRPAPASAATCKWKTAASGNWNTAGNWIDCNNGVPGASDDVVIDATGANYAVTLDVDKTVASLSLNSANATLLLDGHNLTVSGSATIQSGVLRVKSKSYTYHSLTANSGLTNSGTIILEADVSGSGARLVVSGGALVNDGTINANYTTDFIDANLTNNGTVNINHWAKMNGNWTNNGVFNIASGYTFSASSGDVFNQNGDTLTLSGSFDLTSATFNFNGGSVTGIPLLTNAALNIGAGSTGAGTFRFKGTGANAISGTVAAAQTIRVLSDNAYNPTTLSAASGLNNQGTLILEAEGYGMGASLAVSGGALVNDGTINANYARSITADLTNNGTINVSSWVTMNGAWINNGTLNINANQRADFTETGSTYTNNGLTVLASEAQLLVSGTLSNNGELRKTKSVTGSSNVTFFNTGGYGGVIINANSWDLGNTVVRIKGNQDCTTTPGETVQRCFDITPANASGRNATITFYFASSEIPTGQSCANMNGFRWDGSAWQLLTLDTRTCGGDPQSVRVTGVSSFSPFVIKETTPTAVTLRALSAHPAAGRAGIALTLAGLFGLAAGQCLLRKRCQQRGQARDC